MTTILNRSEHIFTSISIVFFSQAFFQIVLVNRSGSSPDIDSPFLRLVFIAIYGITFVLLLIRRQETFKTIKTNKWLFFLIALAVISVLWSSVPGITFRKMVGLVGSTFFGIYLGSRYDFNNLLKIMGWIFGFSILSSFLLIFFLPEYGLMHKAPLVGVWRGIYFHKNGLGDGMFTSFMVFYFLAKSSQKYQLILSLGCVLSVVLIYCSSSATALVSVVFSFLLVQTLKHLSLRSKTSILLILLFLIVALLLQLLITINFATFLEINNRDITLSGRTTLWQSLWEFMKLKFWLGYGYGSFFSASHQETILLWQEHDWGPPHAHNGYIQLWLHLGLVGWMTFAVGYFYNLGKALFQYLVFKDFRMLWIFAFLMYSAFFNLTEVSFVAVNNLNWVISVACIYLLSSMKVTNQS